MPTEENNVKFLRKLVQVSESNDLALFKTQYAKYVGLKAPEQDLFNIFLTFKQSKNLTKIKELLLNMDHSKTQMTQFRVKVFLGLHDPVYPIELGRDFPRVFRDRVVVSGMLKGDHFQLQN